MSNDIAILHDPFDSRGGSERVANHMARMFDAPVVIPWGDESCMAHDVEYIEVFPSFTRTLGRFHYLLKDILEMMYWPNVDALDSFDTLFITKTGPGWYLPRDHHRVIGYVHSTPRNMSDRYDRSNSPLKSLLYTIMRAMYHHTTARYDSIIANSETVARRIKMYWGREVDAVAYPTGGMHIPDPKDGSGYITLSRLEPNKAVSELVDVFTELEISLDVYGDGTLKDDIQSMSGPMVTVHGYIPEENKWDALRSAGAFVFNAHAEDFGLAPIEAMFAGTPVIGVDEGYTSEQIIDGMNGILYDRGQLKESIERFEHEGVQWSPEQIQKDAKERFQPDRFDQVVRGIIDG